MRDKKLPRRFAEALDRLRQESEIPSSSEDLFDIVLDLVEYVAGREDLVQAKERDLEPDALARKLFSNNEAGAAPILGGVAR